MAITLTTSWQALSTAPAEYYRGWSSGSQNINYTATAQARYQVVNGQYQIQLRLAMGTDNNVSWTGTNRHYRLRFLNNPGTGGDSTYRQDVHSWTATGPQSYTLYSNGVSSDPVYKNINPGVTEAITWHYDVGGAPPGITDIDVSKDLYVPVPTPTLTALDASTSETYISWLVNDGEGPLAGTGYVYGGTSPSPTTQLFTTNLQYTTFTHSGLNPNTTYYYRARVQAPNGTWSSYCPDLNITTRSGANNLYGSVNGSTKKVTKLYGSVNGNTKEIIKLYGSVNGQTKRIF